MRTGRTTWVGCRHSEGRLPAPPLDNTPSGYTHWGSLYTLPQTDTGLGASVLCRNGGDIFNWQFTEYLLFLPIFYYHYLNKNERLLVFGYWFKQRSYYGDRQLFIEKYNFLNKSAKEPTRIWQANESVLKTRKKQQRFVKGKKEYTRRLCVCDDRFANFNEETFRLFIIIF